jgi:hypothetical protein
MLSWRRALQFAPDGSLEPSWFRTFEGSSYEEENSLDLEAIARADDSYDFLSLSNVLEFVPDDRRAFSELVRIGSPRCILHCTFASTLTDPESSHFEEPHGPYGRYHNYALDLEQRFEVHGRGLSTVMARVADPVTSVADALFFFCRKRSDAEALSAAFTLDLPPGSLELAPD